MRKYSASVRVKQFDGYCIGFGVMVSVIECVALHEYVFGFVVGRWYDCNQINEVRVRTRDSLRPAAKLGRFRE